MSCTQLSSVRTKKSLAVMLENSHKTVHANVYKQCICKNIRKDANSNMCTKCGCKYLRYDQSDKY